MARRSYICQIRTPILRKTAGCPFGTLSFTRWHTVRRIPQEDTARVAQWLERSVGTLVQKRVTWEGRAIYAEGDSAVIAGESRDSTQH